MSDQLSQRSSVAGRQPRTWQDPSESSNDVPHPKGLTGSWSDGLLCISRKGIVVDNGSRHRVRRKCDCGMLGAGFGTR
jgi:hypothetical protein